MPDQDQSTEAGDEAVVLRPSDLMAMRERLAALEAECNDRYVEIRLLTRKIKAAEYLMEACNRA